MVTESIEVNLCRRRAYFLSDRPVNSRIRVSEEPLVSPHKKKKKEALLWGKNSFQERQSQIIKFHFKVPFLLLTLGKHLFTVAKSAVWQHPQSHFLFYYPFVKPVRRWKGILDEKNNEPTI